MVFPNLTILQPLQGDFHGIISMGFLGFGQAFFSLMMGNKAQGKQIDLPKITRDFGGFSQLSLPFWGRKFPDFAAAAEVNPSQKNPTFFFP